MTRSGEWTLDGSGGRLTARTWEGDSDPAHLVLLAHGYADQVLSDVTAFIAETLRARRA